jgi:hypothetical protein
MAAREHRNQATSPPIVFSYGGHGQVIIAIAVEVAACDLAPEQVIALTISGRPIQSLLQDMVVFDQDLTHGRSGCEQKGKGGSSNAHRI